MFRVYSGEFLINAAAVELDGEYCSHSCFYCYANINKPNRTADIKAITRQLANLHEDDSTEAVLIKMGYPVIISNHVDPLSRSNAFMPPVIHAMYEAGYSVLIQSKLADDISSVESDDHKLLWAITLDTDQDDLGKKIAPGAPLISTRLKHIERLTASGHKVIVLMCPYVDAWYKDIEGFVARLYEIGVTGIWAEPLHLSRTKYKKHVKKKDILTTEQLQDAYNIVWYPDLLRQACKKQKMPLFSSKLGVFGNIYAGIEKLYPRRMPSFQEFLAMSKEYDVYCFEDFMEYAEPLLPKGVFNMRDYIVQNEKDENVRKYKIPNNLTYKELAAVSWGLRPEISKSFLSVHTKLPFMSYLEKNGKIGQLNGKPLYCINYGLHDVIEI